uniref:Ribosomal protein mS38 C-terminal domain-containing protein n=1 Tax=Amblyomma cajennense TaxID=34607 RepID=A0A023FFQ3_AMBCJ
MAFVRAFTRAATELGCAAKNACLISAPRRSLNQLAQRNTTCLPVSGQVKVAAECSPATPSVNRSVVYVPPGVKKPVILPMLRTPWDYTLPSFVRPTAAIGDRTIIAPSSETNSNDRVEKTDPQPTGSVTEKRAVNMLIIRRKKMKKHKLRKLRKRMYFLWAKRRFRREKLKEQAFRAELLSQIHEAQSFDAEKFVTGVLEKLRNRPRPETPEERREKLLELMRKHRSNVQYVKPKFD